MTTGTTETAAARPGARRGGTVWRLDPVHSHLGFSGKQMVISTVRGRFGRFDATLEVEDDRPETARVEARIDATSLDTNFEFRDTHLKGTDFLDVERYPEIVFRSTSVERVDDRLRLNGELTIRAQTRPVTLDVEFRGVVPGEGGERRAAFTAVGVFDRRDWGIVWNVPLGGDAFLVGDEIRAEIEATFVQNAVESEGVAAGAEDARDGTAA